MKTGIFLTLLLLLASAFFLSQNTPRSPEPSPSEAPYQTEDAVGCELCRFKDISLDGQNLKAVWLTVTTPSDLSLLPNFEAKQISTAIFGQNNCDFLINGGFYSQQNKPIGLFVSQSGALSSFETNRLFNAVFSLNLAGEAQITRTEPQGDLIFALQTGPLLLQKGLIQNLAINNDKTARRMVAALTDQNQIIFIAIFDPTSSFNGPLLSQLPRALDDLNQSENLELTNAINLDGGSASAFLLPDFKLTEASPIGSAFCLKQK